MSFRFIASYILFLKTINGLFLRTYHFLYYEAKTFKCKRSLVEWRMPLFLLIIIVFNAFASNQFAWYICIPFKNDPNCEKLVLHDFKNTFSNGKRLTIA